MNNQIIIRCTSVIGAVIFAGSIYANNSSTVLKNTITDAHNRFSSLQFQSENNRLHGLDAWVDKSVVKWGNRDLSNFEDQKISYELQLKNRQQIDAEEALLNVGEEKVNLKIASYLEKQLYNQYSYLIDVVEQQKQQQLLQKQHSLARRDLDGWKLKINSDDFRADKLQQAELTLDNIWGEMLQTGASYDQLRQQSLKSAITNSRTPSINQMIKIISGILQSEEYQYHNLSIQASEIELYAENKKQQRYAAQRKLSLNSFKVEYDNKGEDFGVSLGIKIPITNNSFERLKEKQVRRISLLEAQATRQNITNQLRVKQNKLLQLGNVWNSNQKLLQKVTARMSRLSSTPSIELQSALNIQKTKLIKRNNSIEIECLREYISFLKTAGMLSAKPYRNWLQVGTPLLF